MDVVTRPALLLSLARVAALAGVQRPVVSVWRSRSARTDQPFPPSVTSVRGEERFDLDEVAHWLEATGRGNNPDVRADGAAFALPAAADLGDDEAVFDALTALLCLKAMTGETLAGRSQADVVATADELDPDDEILLGEIDAAGDRLPSLCAFVDQLSDAAFGAGQAFEKLLAAHRRLAVGQRRAVVLAPQAHRLVAALAPALARELGEDAATYLDPTLGGSDLLVSLLRGPEAEAVPTVMTLDHPDDVARLARRRLRVHGAHRLGVAVHDEGAFQVPGPVVHIAHYPSPGRPDMTATAILAAIDNIQLQMDDEQRAVVIAPAAVLCDRLADRALDEQRDQLLRLGRVRAVVRLPQGLLPASPRQSLGLWVLGPGYAKVALDERWTSVADLSDVALSDDAVADLVSDLVAAMGDRATVKAHSFRFARLVPTSRLITGRRALVAPGATARRPGHMSTAQQVVRVQRVRTSLLVESAASDPLAGTRVVVEDGDPVDQRITLGQAIASGLLKVLPGVRIDPTHLAGSGTVSVVGVDEVSGVCAVGDRRIDPLALTATYPSARRTEPGDVVFCTSPRPAALVDDEGGSVVAFPAQVLRVRPGTGDSSLLPAVVAADIDSMPPSARTWRAWSVQRVPSAQVDALSATLDSLVRERAAARARTLQLQELSRLLVHGVASRSFTLVPTPDADPRLSKGC